MRNPFQITKFPFYYIFGLGFINIFDGLIMVLTLGHITCDFSMQYVLNFHRWQINKRKKQLNKGV